MPLRGPLGERYFQVTDPSGVTAQFIEWVTLPSPKNTRSPIAPG
ncbi:hypothetical protein ACNPQM_32285 [Streptomyces sp. NPDC056231]